MLPERMAIPGVERKKYKIGKYDIIAQPVSGSAHMLRYTVMLNGKRLGALMSVPTESVCKVLESPPVVPPLKIFQVSYRPGRPKKNAQPNGANGNGAEGESNHATIPWAIKNQQRY